MGKVLIVPGGGVYFFWMIGFITHVLENFNTDNMVMLAASSGALAAVLVCCQVDPGLAATTAYRIIKKHGAPKRWVGLVGVSGAALEEWLEEVLPADAADHVRGRVRVVVNTAFPNRTVLVSNFRTKQSLIKWLRAACHLPLYMDYKLFYQHQGHWCYDGGINMHKEDYCRMVDCGKESFYYVDYTDDPTHDYGLKCRFVDADFMVALARRGTHYARHLETQGWFDGLERSSRQPNSATNTASANKNTPNSSWYF